MAQRTHGMSKTPLYRKYMRMLDRCRNPNNKEYESYGAAGIICLWKSFEQFYEDMYPAYIEHLNQYGTSETTLERINVNESYSKGNCRWATWKEQRLNKKNTFYVEFKGIKTPLQEISRETGIAYNTLYRRIARGMKPEEAVTLKIGEKIKRLDFNSEFLTLKEWSTKTGIPASTIHMRIHKYGWSIEKTLTEPVNIKKRKKSTHLH